MKPGVPSVHATSSRACCGVCANTPPLTKYSALTCGHYFCNDCWARHFEVQIIQGKIFLFSLTIKNSKLLVITKFNVYMFIHKKEQKYYLQGQRVITHENQTKSSTIIYRCMDDHNKDYLQGK